MSAVIEARCPRVAMVAGEASGDLLGSHLIGALRERIGDVDFFGIGGPKMMTHGFNALYPMERLAVRGYVEVLRHFWGIARIRRDLRRQLLARPPDLFIGIDAPEFNLGLERALKARGVPTVHYVSPQIWAWRGRRIRSIDKAVSHLLVLFPFEQKIYQDAGIKCTFVGHPLADILPDEPDRASAREHLKLPRHATVIALLPGSRQSELKYLGDLFAQTAALITSKRPDIRFLAPMVTSETHDLFSAALQRLLPDQTPSVRILHGHAHLAMTAADVVLVASGTATLEAALLKRPMVITYRVSEISFWIFRLQMYLPYVGLPNVLAGRHLVPELLQHDATPANLARALLNILDEPLVGATLQQHFTVLHRTLRQNNAEKAALAVLPYLEHRGFGAV
ncbi:MAG: lipid-A-disaccharide synthase [Burkholderiales bacterium]